MPDSEIRHKLSGLALRGALTPNEKRSVNFFANEIPKDKLPASNF